MLNLTHKLKITIRSALFYSDKEIFGKQDPYCVFVYEDVQQSTSVKDDAGKQVTWDEEFILENV